MKHLINQFIIGLSILLMASGCYQAELPSHGEPKDGKDVNVQLVGISKDTITVVKEFTYALHATIYPDHAAAKDVLWTSLNEEVATVNDTGLVYAMEFGQTKVVLALKDGTLTDTCVVNVLPNVHVEAVTFNPSEMEMFMGEKITLEPVVLPEDSRVKDVTWSTSDPEIATVDEKGKVEGLKEGTVTITATSVDGGKTGTCVITVKRIAVTGVKLNMTEVTLNPEATMTLKATVEPADAHYPEVTWSSSAPAVVDVDQTGKITAVSLGTATITATTVDGGFTAQCVVTVEEPGAATTTLKLTFNLVPRPESLPSGQIADGEYELVADDGNKYLWEVYHGDAKIPSYSSYLVLETNTYFGTPIIPGGKLKTLTFTQSASTKKSRKSGITTAKHQGALLAEHYDGSVENIEAGGLVVTGTKDTDYTYNIANPVKEARYYLVGGAIGVSKIVLEYEVETPPLELIFDLSTCPASLSPVASSIPNGFYDFVASDGNAYKWEMFAGGSAISSYNLSNGYFTLSKYYYMGTPAIPGRKLKTLTFTQAASTKANRRSAMTTKTMTGALPDAEIDAAEEAQGAQRSTGTKGEDYTYTIIAPQAGKSYYLVCTNSGIGISKIVLQYE